MNRCCLKLKPWAKLSVAIIGVVGAGAALAMWTGASCWGGKTSELVEEFNEFIPESETKRV